jgi:hypothetical protein
MTDGPEKTKVTRRLAAILAADIAGYSALMGADEAGTVRDLKAHQVVVLPIVTKHGGRIIDTAGDGILAEFPSVLNAVESAVAIQRVMAQRNGDAEENRRMRFRIGINQGDVVFDDSRIYGDGVNIAARLETMAEIERARRNPTESLDAYDFYLRGLANYYKNAREANKEALRLYYKAIELDPDFSTAYASAAGCFSERRTFGWVVDREQEIAEARRLARRAVQLGKDDATALSIAGFVLAFVGKELDDGAAFLDRALLINPNLAIGLRAAGPKCGSANGIGPSSAFAHAMRLSPIDPFTYLMQEGMAHAHFLQDGMMKPCPGQEWHCASCLIATVDWVSLLPSCALAGRDEEARRLVARLLGVHPAFRISSLQNVLGPYRHPDPEKYANALRRAGLPE